MKSYLGKLLLVIALPVLSCFLVPGIVWAGIPIPSVWKGQIAGTVYNRSFSLPVIIEIKQALPHENNPLHIYVGTDNPQDIGHLYLTSALQFKASNGLVTLNYLAISVKGQRLQARLINTHGSEAAKANGFTGPNVSAEQASNLMKGILRDAWGPSEMFGLKVGATLFLNFQGNQLYGAIKGFGSSYTATSSDIQYVGNIRATRIR